MAINPTEKIIADNESKYGKEIRTKYGNEAIDKANTKIKGMTAAKYAQVENLSAQLAAALQAAVADGDPSGAAAQKACELHKNWLCCFWDDYSKEAHIGVAEMYVNDSRFTEYYEKIATGGAAFLRDAVKIYCA